MYRDFGVNPVNLTKPAWALHPERFVHGTPKPAPLPEAVWINPPATSTTGETSQ